MENAIEAINLTKYYGELLAVDHINFEVKKSEIFGFLGPNGAGKTTTIRMLTGLTQPSDGTAKIFGYDIQNEIIAAKNTWELFQRFPTFTTISPLGIISCLQVNFTKLRSLSVKEGQKNFWKHLDFTTAETIKPKIFRKE